MKDADEIARVDLALHEYIGDQIEAAGEHFASGRNEIAARVLRAAADRIAPVATFDRALESQKAAWREAMCLARDYASADSEDELADRAHWHQQIEAFDDLFAHLARKHEENGDG